MCSFYRYMFIATATLTFFQLNALPKEGKVVQGEASFSVFEKQLLITQHSERLVIEWEDFSLAKDEIVSFVQPSSDSEAINCINTKIPSKQFGYLTASGHISLINPHGIIIGPDADLTISSFLASTLPFGDEDYLSMKNEDQELCFSGEAEGVLLNLGTVECDRGDVFLIGTWIQNDGLVRAAKGTVGIATGTDILIHPQKQKKIETSRGLSGARIVNRGKIEAAYVEIDGCEGNSYAFAIENKGSILVNSFESKGGIISMNVAPGGVKIEGTLFAKNGSEGGEIAIRADQIALNDKGSLTADGEEIGNGGKIVLVARDRAEIHGVTQARGGHISGDGGLIKFSAYRIDFTKPANTVSRGSGRHGLFFLEPANLYFALENKIESLNWIDLNLDKPFMEMLNSGMDLIVSVAKEKYLENDSDHLDRLGDIVIADPIILGGSGTLILKAERDIVINSPLVNQGGGFILDAERDVLLGHSGEIIQ